MPARSTHPYTLSALEPPTVVTGPIVLAAAPDGEADACIRAAAQVADRVGASLEAVGALEPLAAYAAGVEVVAVSPELEATRREEFEKRVRARLSTVLGEHPWRFDLRLGSPARAVAGAAEERHATLVVAGAGRHGLAERLLGTEIALQMLRLGDRPVLAVSNTWQGLPRRIVCAMDFSSASVRAARIAARLLADGGTLQLLHVTPPMEHVGILGDSWLAQQAQTVRDHFVHVRTLLEDVLPPGAVVEDLVRPGLIVDEILEAALAADADLIAMGTHGRGFLERLFVGSSASGMLRRSPRSVLCAPPPPAVERAWIEMTLRGGTQLDAPREWPAVLDAFTRRHAGRRSWLEVDDPSAGAQVQQRGLTFAGASFDRHDQRIVLTFLDPANPLRHLTRDIPSVSWIALRNPPEHVKGAPDEVLCLAHGRGQTLLGFLGE